MMTGLNSIKIYPFIICLLVSLLLYTLICLFIYQTKRQKLRIKKRIEAIPGINHSNTEKLKPLNKKKKSFKIIKGSKILDNLGERLALSGIMIKPEEFITIWSFIIILPALLGYLISQNQIVALGLSIIGGILPAVYIKQKYSKRMTMFTNQLGDSLTIMSNCLRSGLSLQQAMISISKEMPEPISKEFGRVIREVKYGSTIEDALNSLVERVKSQDLELMVSAILIQRQVGGNLSEILNNISTTIISRVKIKNDIRVMTATGRLSGIIIGALPVGVSLILMVLNPEYFEVFFNSQLGIGLLILCVLMECVGFFFISKVIKIDY